MAPAWAWSFHSIHPKQPAHKLKIVTIVQSLKAFNHIIKTQNKLKSIVSVFNVHCNDLNHDFMYNQSFSACTCVRERERERERESHSQSFASVRTITDHFTDPPFRRTAMREKLQYYFSAPTQVRRSDSILHAMLLRRRRCLASDSILCRTSTSTSVSITQASLTWDGW
jgi:hypothetical protein